MADPTKPHLSPLARVAVRVGVRRGLKGKGKGQPTADEAQEMMAHVTDAVIDQAAADVIVPAADGAAPAAVAGGAVGGKFTDWAAAHKDQIAAIVKVILAALLA